MLDRRSPTLVKRAALNDCLRFRSSGYSRRAYGDDIAGAVMSIPGLRLDRQALADILASPPDVAERYPGARSELRTTSSGAWDTFVNALRLIVVVASGVTGVSGAISGVQAIKFK